MRVQIEYQGNGAYKIASEFPGPLSTVKALRDVIAVVEQAALEAELKAAASAVAVATPAEAALADRLSGHWQDQRRNGMKPG